MRVTFVCNYCQRPEERELYMITLTSITNMKDTCTKTICSKCVSHISAVLDGILDKRDIDATLKEIENDILED